MKAKTAIAPIDTATIPGWGVDADPKNDPTYPYRHRENDPGLTSNWDRPAQQQPDVEILQSIEHKRTPAVFGTSTPPTWVSGMIRRLAFRWSESNWMHWLLLMGADRINVVEGVVHDLGRAKLPNVPAEMGIRSEMKHNKWGLTKKVAFMAVASAVIYGMISLRNQGSEGDDERDYD